MKVKALFFVFVLGALLRLSFLGADPSILLDSGQVGDEGFWVYNARDLALFGKTAGDDFYHDFAAAPLFSFAAYLSFMSFGVGFWQARLVSATSGVLTLIFAYLIARRLGEKTGVLATLLVSINTMLLLHNRLAVGESLAIMFATAGFYLMIIRKNFPLSGISFALSLLSKTTSFLYFPSALLVLVFSFKNKKDFLGSVFKFGLSFAFVFVTIFGSLYLKWGEQIRQIYTTFGEWYAPRNFPDIWQNILNFYVHPFWGSPFLFSLLILAIINALNFLLYKGTRTDERKILLLWIGGIFLLGPLISRLSNARVLGLIIPISILGAQIVLESKVRILDFSGKIFSSHLKGKTLFLAAFLANIPIALIAGKALLAILKRTTGDQTIVYKLPFVFIPLFCIFAVVALKNKKILAKIIKVDLVFVLFLPIASFIPLVWSYLHFFEAGPSPKSTLVSLITLVVFMAFYLLFTKGLLKKLIVPLLGIYIFFNILGIATILYGPTYNIERSSRELGQIVGRSSLIGFWGHELAIGNKSWPIYWAPKLTYVGGVNSDYMKYDPKFLIVTQTFDSTPGSLDAWPDTKSVKGQAQLVKTLDLSRNFWTAKREFKMNVYRLLN